MRTVRTWAAMACLAALGGCATIGYYYQAAYGHLSMMHSARPIGSWLEDPATARDLKSRLEALRAIRDFASRHLALPDNDSYRRYADLRRPFAVWNVVAAEEFSVQPKQWCFLFAGCVSYKGWFDERDAEAAAARLRRDGFEAFVYGVPAYSTLGWFDDPALSTFIRYPRTELARLVFHELAHQVAYAKGDSTFNESFATAVELEGVKRWLEAEGSGDEREEFTAMQARRQGFVALVGRTREQLEALYARALPADETRPEKRRIFADMRADYESLKRSWGGFAGFDRWFAQPLTNAHIASVATYTQAVPAFQALLASQGGDLPSFYREVRRLASAPLEERDSALRTR